MIFICYTLIIKRVAIYPKNIAREKSEVLILAYAIKIRKWLDIHRQKTADKIMQGNKVYHYGNQIKTYIKVC
jgi:hypothetical protein